MKEMGQDWSEKQEKKQDNLLTRKSRERKIKGQVVTNDISNAKKLSRMGKSHWI